MLCVVEVFKSFGNVQLVQNAAACEMVLDTENTVYRFFGIYISFLFISEYNLGPSFLPGWILTGHWVCLYELP